MSTAYVAGGCFWGIEHLFSKLKGVKKTTVGYMGGNTPDPNYNTICTGSTNHAEVVKIDFDEAMVSYKDVLYYFFRMHDPTTLNRQGPDIGTQYRSAIFYSTEEELKVATSLILELDERKVFDSKIVTSLEKYVTFYIGEDYHQDYFTKNGASGCHLLRDF